MISKATDEQTAPMDAYPVQLFADWTLFIAEDIHS